MRTEQIIKLKYGNPKFGILFFLFITYGCSYEGVYRSSGYNFDIKLNLNESNKFIENVYLNSDFDTLYGTWIISSDTLFLRLNHEFNIEYCDKRTRVEEFYRPATDSIFIQVFVNDSIGMSSVFINLNQEPLYTDKTGIVAFLDTYEIKTISTTSLECHDIEYQVQNLNSNVFNVYLYYWLSEPRWTRYNFVDRYLVKSRKLYPIKDNNNRVGGYFLKK